MEETTDLLKIKIEKAKRELSLETVNAIDAVDWKTTIIGFRTKYGYTFEQLGDLELETELLLAGLVSAEDYPKELEKRLQITRSAANDLVKEMNNLVFRKIQEELIKNIERKKIFENQQKKEVKEIKVLSSAGVEIIPDLPKKAETQFVQTEKLELTTTKPEPPTVSMLAQKLSGTTKIGLVKTEHTLDNITKTTNTTPTPQPSKPKVDPYREVPE